MPTHFSEAALKFLRGLAGHNDRDWFEPRREIYEHELKEPMLALIAEVNDALHDFAPDHVRPPQKCMMRIYRDVRFSKDKKPYKTQIAAWWARQGLEKTSGAGFYFHVSPAGVTIAAGCYMPEKDQLLAIRRMLLERHQEYDTLMNEKKLKSLTTPIDGLPMTRGPKGFPTDHPAIKLVMQRQWGVHSCLPIESATSSTLVKEIVKRFRLSSPLVTLLNGPLVNRPSKPLF